MDKLKQKKENRALLLFTTFDGQLNHVQKAMPVKDIIFIQPASDTFLDIPNGAKSAIGFKDSSYPYYVVEDVATLVARANRDDEPTTDINVLRLVGAMQVMLHNCSKYSGAADAFINDNAVEIRGWLDAIIKRQEKS